MPLEYDYDAESKILSISAHGRIVVEEIAQAGDRIKQLGVERVLVDTTSEKETLSYAEMVKATDFLPHGVRLALLVKPTSDPNPSQHHLFVTAAQNRFKQAELFTDSAAALEWLRSIAD